MSELTNISYIKSLLSAHGFHFSKQLGQNFLINPSVCPKMAEECGCDEIGVLEIGPGIGVLTAELAKRAKKVVSVELDERLASVLAVTLKDFSNTELVFGDVLKLDLAALFRERFGDLPVVVCANLPYYITSPVIMKFLESDLPFLAMTVMVQKEAALRLAAKPGTRQAGAVTSAVQYYAQSEKLFDVSSGSFLPAPKVDSSVIRLKKRVAPPVSVSDKDRFFKVIKAAFGQRRKTLPNALSSGLGISKESAISAMNRAEIRQTARAEELTLEEFALLANQF